MRKLTGTGLPNVFLLGGFIEEPQGSVAYRDIDGLYRALAGAIAMRSGALTGAELRFLRKRLGLTQEDVAKLGDKSAQIAAKWEKGTAPVPLAESTVLRHIWLERHARRYLAAAVRSLLDDTHDAVHGSYCMRYTNEAGWREDIEHVRAVVSEQTAQAIAQAMNAATVERASTAIDSAFAFDTDDSEELFS